MSPKPSLTPLEIDCQTVKQKLDQGEAFLFLDCREQNEYDLVHIEGTTLLPMSQIQDRAGELDEHKAGEIVVHCHHGGRSLQVAGWLAQRGFANVKSLAGGIDLWAQEIDPGLARY
jgi:adenylyltransferase/sulfurtransferase